MQCYFSYFTFLEEVSVSGVHLEDCLVPCKTTTYHVTEVTVAKEHHWNEFKGIFIWFEEEVSTIGILTCKAKANAGLKLKLK